MSSDESRQTWNPVIGQETQQLLDELQISSGSKTVLKSEALSVLSRAVPPEGAERQATGLVVGYVQSGKTLSFTTVAALARDNGYPLVIVIAGTSIPLNNQSQARLELDLRLNSRDDRCWRHLHNPKLDCEDVARIENILEDWRDTSVPHDERTTVLITVMKHHKRLQDLTEVLQEVNLQNIPTLIVDDEADQAGLNNLVNEDDESTTYQKLRLFRNAVPHHTFLQYTATPQAPLLINIIDILSPDFAIVLNPGTSYVGGQDFFNQNAYHVPEIPPEDIPTRSHPLHEPPPSLLKAMRIFFLGVASGLIRHRGMGNRSMMVHPSRLTVGHEVYYNWVLTKRNAWLEALSDPSSYAYTTLRVDFQEAYEDLQQTVSDLESFERLMAQLQRTIRRTELYKVNASSGRTPEIDWRGTYAHILVGGQALDRGFTVKGLTITYMPRGVGARRADTIQQRARFFGYHQAYFGYCRVFLERETLAAFTHYVRHEEDIRERLLEYANQPLNNLRRIFLLPQGLQPTRDSIIDDSVAFNRIKVKERWFYPNAPHELPLVVEENRYEVEQYLQSLDLTNDIGSAARSPSHRHELATGVSLRDAYLNLLMKLRLTNLDDSKSFTGVLVVIRQWLDNHPDETCTIYNINRGTPRRRKLNSDEKISFFFQGANQARQDIAQGEIYPGDKRMRSETGITIQIHNLNITNSEGQPIINDVRSVAIWIPKNMSGDVMIQDQGGIEEFGDE